MPKRPAHGASPPCDVAHSEACGQMCTRVPTRPPASSSPSSVLGLLSLPSLSLPFALAPRALGPAEPASAASASLPAPGARGNPLCGTCQPRGVDGLWNTRRPSLGFLLPSPRRVGPPATVKGAPRSRQIPLRRCFPAEPAELASARARGLPGFCPAAPAPPPCPSVGLLLGARGGILLPRVT